MMLMPLPQSSVERSRLLAELHQARVALVAAPIGFGKSELLQRYMQHYGMDGVLFIGCTPEDVVVQSLANRLTRTFTHVFQSDLFSSIYSDFYNLTMRQSPEGMARIIANDLLRYPQPLLIIFSGLVSVEAAIFATELSRLAPPHIRFIISGYSSLAEYRLGADLVLEAADLEFTPLELEAMEVPGEIAKALDHWPQAIELYRSGGQTNVQLYATQQARRMEMEAPELLAAALLSRWQSSGQRAELEALGLPPDYLSRIQAYGWPMTREEGDTFQPYALLRDAMLAELEIRGERHDRELALAAVIEDSQPVRALELRSRGGDEEGALALARENLDGWFRQGQWTQIVLFLSPYYRLLTLDERTKLARAMLESAVNKKALRAAKDVTVRALYDGGPHGELGVILAETFLRLGRVQAARKELGKLIAEGRASPRGTADPGLVAWEALINVQVREVGLARLALSEDLQARRTILGQVAYALSLSGTGEPKSAYKLAQQAYDHYFMETTVTSLLENIRGVFALIQVLSDGGSQQNAQDLLRRLPEIQPGYWFTTNVLHLRGMLAWRQFDEEQARELLTAAATRAREGQDDELLVRILQTSFLMNIYFHRYSEAARVHTELQSTGMGEEHLAQWATEARRILDWAQGGVRPSSLPTSLLESGLVLRVMNGGALSPFPAGLKAFWEGWKPLPEMKLESHVAVVSGSSRSPLPQSRRIQVQVLGRTEVLAGDRPVRLSPGYLTLLTAFARGPQDAGDLARLLYGELQNPANALRTNLSRLKAKLGPARDALVRGKEGMYALAQDWAIEVDVHQLLDGPVADVVGRYGPLSVPVVYGGQGQMRVMDAAALVAELQRRFEKHDPPDEALAWRLQLHRRYPAEWPVPLLEAEFSRSGPAVADL